MKPTVIYAGVYVAFVVVSALILLPDLFILWLVLSGAGLLALVRWHQRAFAYECGKCGAEFQIGFMKELTSMQGFSTSRGWKYLRCPFCGARTRATVVPRGLTLP